MQHRTINGVDVYEVGKEQLWDWCYECHAYGWGRCIDNYADSLDAGRYALVSSHVRFGKFAGLSIVNTYGSLRSALRAAQTYIDAESNIPFGTSRAHGMYSHEYEVWHIVDDCELYGDWCARAAASLQIDAGIDWALDNIALAGAPVCALCGDSWGGPWVMRGTPKTGRYWLCEFCDEKVNKIMDNYARSGVRVHV